jgi:hypothetical protein
MIRTVESLDDLVAQTGGLKDPAVVAFFGQFSEKSLRAWPVFEAFCKAHPDLDVHRVDVGQVKDVHRRNGPLNRRARGVRAPGAGPSCSSATSRTPRT